MHPPTRWITQWPGSWKLMWKPSSTRPTARTSPRVTSSSSPGWRLSCVVAGSPISRHSKTRWPESCDMWSLWLSTTTQWWTWGIGGRNALPPRATISKAPGTLMLRLIQWLLLRSAHESALSPMDCELFAFPLTLVWLSLDLECSLLKLPAACSPMLVLCAVSRCNLLAFKNCLSHLKWSHVHAQFVWSPLQHQSVGSQKFCLCRHEMFISDLTCYSLHLSVQLLRKYIFYCQKSASSYSKQQAKVSCWWEPLVCS